jgi:hypothetical protein
MLIASAFWDGFADGLGKGMGYAVIGFTVLFICWQKLASQGVKDAAKKAASDKAMQLINRVTKK